MDYISFECFQAILTIGCLFGNYLNCKKLRICFIIWIVCNIGWCCVDIINGAYSRMLLNIVQIAFNVYGIKEWTNKSNTDKEVKQDEDE